MMDFTRLTAQTNRIYCISSLQVCCAELEAEMQYVGP